MCGEQKIKFPKDQKGQRSLKGHTHTHMKILMISFVFVFFFCLFAFLLFCSHNRDVQRAATGGFNWNAIQKQNKKLAHEASQKIGNDVIPTLCAFFCGAAKKPKREEGVCVCVCGAWACHRFLNSWFFFCFLPSIDSISH